MHDWKMLEWSESCPSLAFQSLLSLWRVGIAVVGIGVVVVVVVAGLDGSAWQREWATLTVSASAACAVSGVGQ